MSHPACQVNISPRTVPEYIRSGICSLPDSSVRCCHPDLHLYDSHCVMLQKASSLRNKIQYPRIPIPQWSLLHDSGSVLLLLCPDIHYKMSALHRVHLLHRGSSRSQACGERRCRRSHVPMPAQPPWSGNPHFPVPCRSNIRLLFRYSP